jgi:chromosome segregation ATPase
MSNNLLSIEQFRKHWADYQAAETELAHLQEQQAALTRELDDLVTNADWSDAKAVEKINQTRTHLELIPLRLPKVEDRLTRLEQAMQKAASAASAEVSRLVGERRRAEIARLARALEPFMARAEDAESLAGRIIKDTVAGAALASAEFGITGVRAMLPAHLAIVVERVVEKLALANPVAS